MQFSIRTLFGLTLLSAVLFNPARYFFQTAFVEALYKAFINVNLWFSSFFLYFEPDYYDLHKTIPHPRWDGVLQEVPIDATGIIGGAFLAALLWGAIIFWGGCAILEIFRIPTPLRPTIDMLEYKIKMARYKHPN